MQGRVSWLALFCSLGCADSTPNEDAAASGQAAGTGSSAVTQDGAAASASNPPPGADATSTMSEPSGSGSGAATPGSSGGAQATATASATQAAPSDQATTTPPGETTDGSLGAGGGAGDGASGAGGAANPSGGAGGSSPIPEGGSGGMQQGAGGSRTTDDGSGAGGATLDDGSGAGGASGEPPSDDPSAFEGMELFILFGQSNMAGSAPIEEADRATNPRVKVFGMYDCPEFGRVYNEWAVASPPLHACFGELGPGDSFAKGLAEAWPNSEIGLIPNAVPGVEIDFFRKGMTSREDQSYKELPRDWNSAYAMMVERTQLAMESGRVRGILFHQGESDSGDAAWVGKVAEIVADLRTDLALGDEVPFIAGELPPTGCCGGHNTYVNQLPGQIPNALVVSAAGLTIHDQYHFDSPSVRTFGQRYLDAFLDLVPTP